MHGNENQQLLLYEKRLFSCQSSLKRYQKKIGLISFKKGTTSTTPIEFMCRVGFHEENCFLTSKKVSCEIFFSQSRRLPPITIWRSIVKVLALFGRKVSKYWSTIRSNTTLSWKKALPTTGNSMQPLFWSPFYYWCWKEGQKSRIERCPFHESEETELQ